MSRERARERERERESEREREREREIETERDLPRYLHRTPPIELKRPPDFLNGFPTSFVIFAEEQKG